MSKPQSATDVRKRELFLTALEKEDSRERAAFLDGACGNDTELRAAVEALLRKSSRGQLPGTSGRENGH